MTIQASVPAHPLIGRIAEERAALQAVLNSEIFRGRPRLASLLQYLCERYFDGDTDRIKEYSIAMEVFRRPSSFDQATDSIVRVEAFRLRKKLREFYCGEGAGQLIEIVIATGHYRPEFVDRAPLAPAAGVSSRSAMLRAGVADFPRKLEIAGSRDDSEFAPDSGRPWTIIKTGRRFLSKRVILAAAVVALAAGLGALVSSLNHLRKRAVAYAAQPALDTVAAAVSGPEVRIRCGYSRPMFKDDEGNVWSGDRYFSGGFVTELPDQHIAGTRDPELYLTARSGVFSYKIPLAQGAYEMHLHFAETTYSPESTLGGGENSRVFDVRLNGRPMLSQFDIVSDAGANTADVRVFRDVSPDKDGYLHLDFNGSLGLPIINAIEILPGLPHRLRPIRMVARNSFYVDRLGNLWMPDAYFSSGRVGPDRVIVAGTAEPGLFAGERYGNFAYALPVDDGAYKLTLYFSEKYWGVGVAQKDSAGKRVFDIFCNGTALTRRLDIAKEVGPGRALVKVYHNLQPNAQGKLIVSFVPEVNYASVDAVEVEQERP
jgi:hypothetical protein